MPRVEVLRISILKLSWMWGPETAFQQLGFVMFDNVFRFGDHDRKGVS